MFSIPAAPAKQSVGETISVLSGRLGSATLLEDRRAAILGLRSFAKQYPASVASGALRSLIGSLRKDGEDVDTVKVVLETLLMLFGPNQGSPEASDEIALWVADEFTQRQENITLLLDFLETPDFYSRLYSLQLLSAILSARTERTEECVFTAPLGISRLVAILDERREAVRNEAITLLTYLTPTSIDIQKLVAFESAFERIFAIVAADGGLAEGSRVVEDCLILLANLLRLNPSNQTLFRETGCIPSLSGLLRGAYGAGAGPGAEAGAGAGAGDDDRSHEMAPWAEEQQRRNVYALLAVIRLFLLPGSAGTAQNQAAFWQHGLLFHALQLAFNRDAEIQIRGEALVTCADIIRGNAALQENFAQLQVPSPLEQGTERDVSTSPHPQPDKDKKATKARGGANGVFKVYVIDGLLDLTLSVHSAQEFDLRFAACGCLEAYFFRHQEVRQHFLARAIEGHRSGADETANVLTTLLRSSEAEPTAAAAGTAAGPSAGAATGAAGDPYRYWFAAVIMLHLIHESPPAKAMVMAVTEGDESSGEEVITSIQTITARLISSINKGEDDRVVIGCLMLLLCWLFEDLDGVNDFLGEGSNVQALIQAVVGVKGAAADPMGSSDVPAAVQGLCAALLGVVYEFSTKDSPVPRATLQPLLLGRIGRDRYMDKLGKLRSHPLMRDFEVLPQRLDPASGARKKLPDVYFDATFVEFFKDNYSRLLRAIDREAGIEVSVVANGVQKGISRELVDALRAQVDEKDRAIQDAQSKAASLDRLLGQEQADHRRDRETAAAELARVKAVNESIHRHHDEETSRLRKQQQAREDELQRQLRAREEEFQRQMEQLRKTGEVEAERAHRRNEAAMADLRATISRLEVDLMKANKSKTQEVQATRDALNSQLATQTAAAREAGEAARNFQRKLEEKEKILRELEQKSAVVVEQLHRTEAMVKQIESEKKSIQNELDDLLMVFGDLEEKVAKYKGRLVALGEAISDADEEEEDDEDD